MGVREDVLALRCREREVETPGGTVLVRGMTLALKDHVQRAAAESAPWRGIVVAHCCLDPATGERLFGDADIEALHDLPTDMECVIDAVLELSAMTDAEVEELEGNSERTPSSGTESDLRVS